RIVLHSLLGGEVRADLRTDPCTQCFKARTRLLPERVERRVVTVENGANAVLLCGAQVQRVGEPGEVAGRTASAPSRVASAIGPRSHAGTRKDADEEHGGEQRRGAPAGLHRSSRAAPSTTSELGEYAAA